jgi:hypothetical protein
VTQRSERPQQQPQPQEPSEREVQGGRLQSRRRRLRLVWAVLLAVLTGLATPVLAIATNVATSSDLPKSLQPYGSWAWPAFWVLAALLLFVGVGGAILQHRAAGDEPPSQGSGPTMTATSTGMTAGNGASVSTSQAGGDVTGDQVTMAPGGLYVKDVTNATFLLDTGRASLGDRLRAAGDPVLATPSVPPRTRPSLSLLPPDIPDFTDRTDELALLRRTLAPNDAAASASQPPAEPAQVAILAVAGGPGIGKSVLAIHLAHQVAELFPDGQLYVNLRGADNQPLPPEVALDTFLRATGTPAAEIPPDLPSREAVFRAWMSGKWVLLILDNAAEEAQVGSLLPNRPPAAAIITSRKPLAIPTRGRPVILKALTAEDATTLLWATANRTPTGDDHQFAANVARHCQYLPLALRIAGATLTTRPAWTMRYLDEVLGHEDTRLEQLSVNGLGTPNLDVRSSCQVSYTALPADLARTFRLLGSLPDPDLTVERIVALTGLPVTTAANHLDRLADAQLLEPTEHAGRYQISGLIRLFAVEQHRTIEQPDVSPNLDDEAAIRSEAAHTQAQPEPSTEPE